ncbi:MAG: hypothetical protein ABII74_09895 [Elusimicrobiota bacterium]
MNKKYIRIAKSHKDAHEFYEEMDLKKSPGERMADLTFLRRQYFKLKGYTPEQLLFKKVVTIIHRHL